MPTMKEYTFTSSDSKTKIRVRRWDPDGAPRGIVQIAHGVAEHVERYDGFMSYLAENGFIAAANDHLGHGKSVTDKSNRGYFAKEDGWNLVVRDMHKLHDELFSEHPELPFFLFGHSMGSFLARTYIINYPAELSGAVICGTGHQDAALVNAGGAMASLVCKLKGDKHKSKFLNSVAFGSYNNGFKPNRTEYDWLSRDPDIVDKYIADPLCGYITCAGQLRDMMGGIKYITDMNNMVKMRKTLPVFFIAGEKDPVGENGKGVRKACEAFRTVGMEDVSIKLYPECRHEILNELNKDEVMKDVLVWIESKM